MEEESSAGFVPVVWFIYLKNAAELDSVSQANGNETLVLCSASTAGQLFAPTSLVSGTGVTSP